MLSSAWRAPSWVPLRLLPVALLALSRAHAQPPAPAAPAAPVGAGTKILSLDDYGRWRRISGTGITPNGKWMSYILTPNEVGEASLRLRPLDGGDEIAVGLGAPPGGRGGAAPAGGRGGAGGVGSPSFSEDSKWVTYIAPVPTGRVGGGGGGGAPGGNGGRNGAPAPQPGRGAAPAAAASTPPATRLELRNLATGAVTLFPGVASASFSPGAKYLVLRMSRPAGAPAGSTASDIVLHDLANGTDRNIGNVGQFAFNTTGTLFAYTVDAAEKLGNGVFVLDPATGLTQTLAAARADFDAMAWNATGNAIAVLAGTKAPTQKQRVNTLHVFSNVTTAGAGAKHLVVDPAAVTNFPKDMVVSEYATPRWSRDGNRLFIGIKPQEPEVAAADSNKANVDVFHYKDQTVQSVQLVQVAQLRRATWPAAVDVASGAFVQLGNDDMRTVTPAPNGAIGIGRDDHTYRGEIAWGASRADYYKVDLASGQRTLIAKGISRAYGVSPDSRWFLFAEGTLTRAHDLTTGRTVTLDASGTPRKSYINEDDDHAYELPLWGVAGWSRDGKSVLLYDKFDVWSAPLDGGKAVNLTKVGRAQEIQFRVVSWDDDQRGGRGGGFGGGVTVDTTTINLSAPLTLSAYGTRSKKTGYFTLTPGQAPQPIVWEDRSIGSVIKADSADRLLYVQQKFDEFPNYWMTNTKFENRKPVTDANPFIKEYAWSAGKILIDYTNARGQKLQGTLALPANYEKGKRYPMLVEFYEIMSNTHHTFSQPGYSNSPQLSTYNSDGYITFQPDMTYEIGRPGTSAVDNMTAAVKKVIELGYADPKHIGLHGHSWSGYQSTYILTHSNLFAAVVSGAPPTNLLSFYNTLYRSTGTVQQGITTVGQVRMGRNVTPFNSTKLYIDQSPIFSVDKITTPFMILQGTDDGAVDYTEGLQFFNAARAAGKEAVFMSYPGEAHNLVNRDNQKDFTIRMKQFYDHYLKGAPAPQWLREGMPAVNKGGPIK